MNPTTLIFIEADYIDSYFDSYRGVIVTDDSEKVLARFDSGDFHDDCDNAQVFAQRRVERGRAGDFRVLSSVDNYSIDLKKFA